MPSGSGKVSQSPAGADKAGEDRSSGAAPRPRSFLVQAKNASRPQNTPGPRCGHTLTALSSAPERSPDILILIGGATALEGGSDGASKGEDLTASPSGGGGGGGGGIRLAGATSDVHIMQVATGLWERIEPGGEAPSPRAAHAAAAVGHMVVVQGGIGPAGLASEDLHVLDFSNPTAPRWHRVVVQGPGPGARYAHTLALVANRFLVAIGGNDGKQTLSDAWALDTSEKPYQWRKIEISPGASASPSPSARMYATTCTRQDGLLLLMGGRDETNTPMADAHGLVRHRDGRWEWTPAPGIASSPRYQHGAVFVGGRMHVIGGALGGNKLVGYNDSVSLLDTTNGVWSSMSEDDILAAGDSLRRCRHAVTAVGSVVFIYGGLRGGLLLDDMLVSYDSDNSKPSFADENSKPWKLWLSGLSCNNAIGATALIEAAEAEAAAAMEIHKSNQSPNLQCLDESESDLANAVTPDGRRGSGVPPKYPGAKRSTPATDVRLHHRAVVVAADSESEGALGGLVRQLSIDQFENESRRVSAGSIEQFGNLTPVLQRSVSFQGVHKRVLQELLRPNTWKAPADRSFILRPSEIVDLCDAAEAVFSEEPTVLKIQAPVKIFGDLHGQFGDLMRLFLEFGTPMTGGDITYIDYLFLGDYVDRGSHSLEIMCLLLALKIEYKRNIHLIRGNHEAADINALFGFRLECTERLGESGGIWIWQRMNELFNWMPLAATIEDKIVCMHGGIGKSINSIADIESIQRPVSMETGGPLLMDLLWSDPTMNDSVEGVLPSPRGPGLVTFGPDRVKAFCQSNNFQMIIRAHECVMDGFERFAGGQLITLFSATNYCGTANNAGAILVVGRDLVLVPKLIHPLPPQMIDLKSRERISLEEFLDDGSAGARVYVKADPDTWMQSINDDRPPTPPRGRPNANMNKNNLAYF
ncbi:serine/threonine-protein phosphatase [Chloropicon primus]|uniref:Serine/threonine-protein phosphatase n=1 Tax=Chloropicon primus TaxID=1764295 RepID=A0A5B8MBU2_9CHLO|nr:serine/threonine-protein phosphatase [Chloropicon primus]UPQ97073.1 serine/threonine-protein phosphatase [Chloropicon primus]|eukprot:QDZ17857.1 serine/threonine-protein phosphatase [Chloropicon primus]